MAHILWTLYLAVMLYLTFLMSVKFLGMLINRANASNADTIVSMSAAAMWAVWYTQYLN